jgi:dTDP-4-dehydrorhamnose reductase
MLRLAREGKPIRVVNDQVLSPSSASEVAGGAIELLRRGARGLRHLTNGGHCSWFEFAQAIFQLAGVQADLAPTTSAAYGAPARRPAYSVLATNHEDTPRLSHWRDALAAYLEQRPSAG